MSKNKEEIKQQEAPEEPPKKKKGGFGIFVLLLLVIFAGAVIVLWQLDELDVRLSIPETMEVKAAYGEPYEAPEVTAVFGGTELIPELFPLEVTKTSDVDTQKLGDYTEEYTASFLFFQKTAVRKVHVVDMGAPELTLTGGDTVEIKQGEKWEEPGFAAVDLVDGDLTEKVDVRGTVNSSICGEHIIEYKVKDSAGNETSVKRKVIVMDTEPPKITLKGESSVTVKLGGTYEEPGYSAEDNTDGKVAVTVSGAPDTSKAGVYGITYTAEDAAGNRSEKTRTVYVTANQSTAGTKDPGNKVVYLTFDDGPGKYTQELLDVLAKYDVKATFFVTNQFPKYKDMIAKEYEAGHTVAIHTYTHDFATVYASEKAYFDDLEKMAKLCEQQTGVRPTILRFPGGTSNKVSAKYCSGIMTTLSKSVGTMGYKYCDWNVDSNDAGGAKTAQEVADNVIAGLKKHNVSYVLQHDIKKFSVEAVEQIIQWGQENGYTFLPLTDSSPMNHHHVNN